MEEARSEIECLPDEVLLMIFRYLGFKDLQLAEQVCARWKAVVQTRFGTVKKLHLILRHIREKRDGIKLVKRCAPSLQTLFLRGNMWWNKRLHWISYIGSAEAFPNLKSLSLSDLNIKNEDFITLSVKCSQLKSISFYSCVLSDEGLGLLLKGLPGLQHLRTFGMATKGDWGECFSHLGGNLEYLSMSWWRKEITTAGLSQLFSKCKKVKTLELEGPLNSTELFSKWCQESVSVKKLLIGRNSFMTKLSFSQISRLSLLEELDLYSCDEVDSDTLIDISRGCLNLRHVKLCLLPNICDRGLKSLSGCRNLSEFICSLCSGVTEESLVELGKSGSLKRMVLVASRISNSGCAAILDQCLQLEELDVKHCKGVVDGIVDIAIQAIENRANGVLLHLYIEDTGVDPKKETRTHPLLTIERPVVCPGVGCVLYLADGTYKALYSHITHT